MWREHEGVHTKTIGNSILSVEYQESERGFIPKVDVGEKVYKFPLQMDLNVAKQQAEQFAFRPIVTDFKTPKEQLEDKEKYGWFKSGDNLYFRNNKDGSREECHFRMGQWKFLYQNKYGGRTMYNNGYPTWSKCASAGQVLIDGGVV